LNPAKALLAKQQDIEKSDSDEKNEQPTINLKDLLSEIKT